MQGRSHIVSARIKKSRSRSAAFYVGVSLKYVLLAGVAFILWKFVGDGPDKAKHHGYIMAAVAGYLAIQEAYFQVSRAKINESLTSPAVEIADLDALHERVIRMKAHLDMLWKIAVPAKFVALACAAMLSQGGISSVAVSIRSIMVTWNDLFGYLGWFAILVGIDLTWRTFALFRHVDAFNTKLGVKAKEITAQKEAAAKLKAEEPGKNWPEDPTPRGYPRLRVRNS
jgi:hypothetical protein